MPVQTLAVTTSHYDGTLSYNTHNLYNLYFTKAVYEGLVQLRQKRPFILTRSALPQLAHSICRGLRLGLALSCPDCLGTAPLQAGCSTASLPGC